MLELATLRYVQGTFISVDNVDILLAKGQLFPFEDHSRQAHCWQPLIVHSQNLSNFENESTFRNLDF